MTFFDMKTMYTMRKTLASMLRRRGFTVPPNLIVESLVDFSAIYNDVAFTSTIVASKNNVTLERLVIFFADVEIKLGIVPIRDHYIPMMQEMDVQHGILVSKMGLTNPAIHALRELPDVSGVWIETFTEAELLFDLMSHEKVPLHRLLTPSERQKILKKYRVTDKQLMILQLEDPVSKYLGLAVGDVIEITRMTQTANMRIYRIVEDSESNVKK